MASKLMLSPTQKTIFEKFGSWITYWTPASPKTNGLCLLRDFLETHKAWDAFIKNYYTVPKIEGYCESYEYIMNTSHVHGIIYWAFNWSKSKEGIGFWQRLDLMFKPFLKDREDEGINLNEICYNPKDLTLPPKVIGDKVSFEVIKTRRTKQKMEDTDFLSPLYLMLSGATNMISNAMETWSRPNVTPNRFTRTRISITVPLTRSTITEFKTIEIDE